MTVRVGVVGFGAMGEAHTLALRCMDGVEVSWICDTNEMLLDAARTRLGITESARDYRDLLSSDVDAVIIATPEAAHTDPALEFLRAGKDILIEKPLTTDGQQARMILEETERSGRLVVPGMNLRYEPRFRMVRDWICDGRPGPVRAMSFRRNRPQPLFERYSRVHPGFETGSHDIDLAIWYLGDRAKRVFAVQRQRDGDENPFGLWGVVEFVGGAVATFETVWLLPGEARLDRDDLLEVIGEDGTARVEIADPGVVFLDRSGRYSKDPIYDSSSMNDVSLSLVFELQDFVAAVRGERARSVFSLEDAVHGVEVVEAMIASAESGEPVELARPVLA